MRLEIVEHRVEHVAAEALLVPVDGQLCVLGGATAGALRAALSPDERDDELEYVTDALARLRPLRHPNAQLVGGVGPWAHLLISAAYPHDVDGRVFGPHECAQMLRGAIAAALATAAAGSIASVAATVIGTAYRMPAELAVRAFLDGVLAARASTIVRWSIPEADVRATAFDAARRLGLLA